LLYGDLTGDGDKGDRRWVKDVKGIGRGEDFERVTIERPNAAWVTQFRGLLDDIAKEVGDRKPKDDDADGGTTDERAIALMSDEERSRRVLELVDRAGARRAGRAALAAEPAP